MAPAAPDGEVDVRMNRRERLRRYVGERKIHKGDVIVILLLCLAFLGITRWKDWYELFPSSSIELVNPYLAQSDGEGNTYVIDSERSRIVKLNQEGRAEYFLQSNLREADTFWYAEDLAIGEDGTLYVLDASWDDTGSAVARECILAYDAEGNYQDTLLDINYEERVDKHRLYSLTLSNGGLYYVNSDVDGFSLFRLGLDSRETEEIAFYAYEDAFNLIQDYAVDSASESVYALDKRGRILKGTESELTQLYDTATDPAFEGVTTFYRAAVDSEQNLYITDIRQNRVLRYHEGEESPEVYLENTESLSVSAALRQDGSTELGFCTDGGILMQNLTSGEELSGAVFAKTASYLMREAVYQLCAVAAVLCGLWLLVRLIVLALGVRLSSIQRTGLLAGGTAAIVAAIIVTQLLGQFENVYREELMNRLYILASTVSGMVDGDSLERIESSEDYMGEDYQRLMEAMQLGLNQDDPSVQEVYCNVLRYEDGQGFAIAYLDNSIGTYYPRSAEESEELAHIYETGEVFRSYGALDETGSYIYVSVPVLSEDGQVAGVIEIGTTSEVITSQVDEMRSSIIVTLVVVILIVLFLFGEILSYFDLRDRYRKKEKEAKRSGMPMHLLRLSIFVTYMAFNVASSFLAVYAASFVTDDLGLPRELAASLPITLNLIFVGVTSLFCAGLLRRFSFRTVAAVSGLISMAGDSLLFTSHSYWLLVLGLILNGTGMGLITNSISMFIAGSEEDEVKQNGFSIFNAGSLSGINVGMMLGASLAGALGQRTVFLCSASAWLLVAVLFLIMGKYMSSFKREKDTGKKGTGAFLASRGVVPYMLLIQFPYVIINSFVFYYVPIYGDAQGFSESIVCLLLMLNSLCSVYLSVSATNFVSRKLGQGSIYLSSLLSLAALLLFGFDDSVQTMIVVLLVLGVASSFGTSVRQLYFSKLPGVSEYGEEPAMGIYSFMDNIGESAGPMLFGSIMSASSTLPGLAAFTVVSAAMNGLYAALFGRNKKQ